MERKNRKAKVRGIPCLQKRETWGTQFGWKNLLPEDLGHPPRDSEAAPKSGLRLDVGWGEKS
jgi:hypothetical protein